MPELNQSIHFDVVKPPTSKTWNELKAKFQLIVLKKGRNIKKHLSFHQDYHDWTFEHEVNAKKCCTHKKAEKDRRKSMKTTEDKMNVLINGIDGESGGKQSSESLFNSNLSRSSSGSMFKLKWKV